MCSSTAYGKNAKDSNDVRKTLPYANYKRSCYQF